MWVLLIFKIILSYINNSLLTSGNNDFMVIFLWHYNSYFISCLNTLVTISRKFKITSLVKTFQTCKTILNADMKLGACTMELFFMWLFNKSPVFQGEPDEHTTTWALTFLLPNWSGQDAFFRKNSCGIYLLGCSKEDCLKLLLLSLS